MAAMTAIAKKTSQIVPWLCSLLVFAARTPGQSVNVTAQVELRNSANTRMPNASEAVVWLSYLQGAETETSKTAAHPPDRLRLTQHNKSFDPHLLIVTVGSIVEFPNRDPFFHNVFSLFEGRRFDLGLYEAGRTRNVRFDRPGISYIFCNIHPEMSAVVIALETPYSGVSNSRGEIVIPSVPSGRYAMHVWHQLALPETLSGLTREVGVSLSAPSLGVIRLTQSIVAQAHKNKYGRDYDPPAPANPGYRH